MLRFRFALFGLLVSACDCTPEPVATTCDPVCAEGEVCESGRCVSALDSGMAIEDATTPDSSVPACVDMDNDGAFAPSATCVEGTDCDDRNPRVRPGIPETCTDTVDNNCDGTVDEATCDCERGERLTCYGAAEATANVGLCRIGVTLCLEGGAVDACRGEVLPIAETCDGSDEDCDGQTDEGLRNACGQCGDAPAEQCGNAADDDCDGSVDEECDCDARCECADATSCICTPPVNQPCYEGPYGTGGVGLCRGGRRDCVASETGVGAFGMCNGQVLPASECSGGANGDDDDCDGVVDEGCRDGDGDGAAFPSDCDDEDAAIHPGALETCNGRDDNCNRVADEGVTNACGGCFVPTATDTCGNGLDDDCNGVVDDDCACSSGQSGACYGGPDGTQGIGLCRAGTRMCASGEFSTWGMCSGQQLPLPEVCNGDDDDCDGEADERWATGSNACGYCNPVETCDGEDQDCDGRTDEGLANRCGSCGAEPTEVCNETDDDCDGIVDEGVTNACGTCAPAPCFIEEWETVDNCEAPLRNCDDVTPSEEYPGGVTLSASTLDFDYIYIAVTARNEVAQLDTRTGVKNWQVASHGVQPSRTAVAHDGSVWVTNRAYSNANAADVNQSNVVHLDAHDGHLICRAPVLNVARSVAIDRNGDIWAGSYNNGDLYHISGEMVDASTNPPTCVVIRRINVGRNIYGLAADPDGFMWTSSSPSVRINIADYTTTTFTNPTHYGIAADGNGRVWFGGWSGGGAVHALDRTTGAVLDTGVRNVTAVTVHPNGSIWGSSYGTNDVVSFDGTTGVERCRRRIPSGTNPHGAAVDSQGRIWVPSRFGSGTVNVFDTDCNHLQTYLVDAGQELYSYSDMTGHLLRTFVSPEGHWSQVFDSGYAGATWNELNWDSVVPADTAIDMTVISSDTVDGAGTSCGPFVTSPADLTTCPEGFQNHRFLQVQARLSRTGSSGARPVLRSVDASWAY